MFVSHLATVVLSNAQTHPEPSTGHVPTCRAMHSKVASKSALRLVNGSRTTVTSIPAAFSISCTGRHDDPSIVAQRTRTTLVRGGDFVSKALILARIACERAQLELTIGLQGTANRRPRWRLLYEPEDHPAQEPRGSGSVLPPRCVLRNGFIRRRRRTGSARTLQHRRRRNRTSASAFPGS